MKEKTKKTMKKEGNKNRQITKKNREIEISREEREKEKSVRDKNAWRKSELDKVIARKVECKRKR